MKAFLQVLAIIVQIFPAIVQFVKELEKAIPGKGIGAARLEALQGFVLDVVAALPDDQKQHLAIDTIQRAVKWIADRIVAVFNKVGWPG